MNTRSGNVRNNFSCKVVEATPILDTISVASIQDDEEGTNLNAKGINTNYVKVLFYPNSSALQFYQQNEGGGQGHERWRI